MANSEELIGITKNLTLWTRSRINRCRYNRAQLYTIIVFEQAKPQIRSSRLNDVQVKWK
jgi:hypothetical protein